MRRDLSLAFVAVAVGLVGGACTAIGQQVLPDSLRSLANSSGSWLLVAFATAWWSRRAGGAIACAVLVLWSLLGGYAVASELRGFSVSAAMVVFWGGAGALVGPAVGLGALWARRSGPVRAGAGMGLPSGVLVGEAVYGLTVIGETTSAVYWWLQAAAGGLLVAAHATARREALTLGVALAVSVGVAGAFVAVYSRA